MVTDVTHQIESISTHGGLFDKLGEPESLLHIVRLADTPGIKGSRFERELRTYQPKEGALLSPSWHQLAQRLRDFLFSHPIEVLAVEQAWLPFRIHTLYCPPTPDAKATLKITSEEGLDASCRIEVFGFGGGPEFSVSFTTTDSFSTAGESLSVNYEFLTVWEQCKRTDPDGQTLVFPRLKEVRHRSQRVSAGTIMPAEPDAEWGESLENVEIDLTKSKATMTRYLEIAFGTKWEMSSCIEVFGSKIGPKYAATAQWKTVCEFTLSPGHLYQARRFKNAPWWWWTLKGKS